MHSLERIYARWVGHTALAGSTDGRVVNPDGTTDTRTGPECVQEFVDQAGTILKQIRDSI